MGVGVVCSDVDRCEFRCEVRWALEVKLGDREPDRALVGTIARNLKVTRPSLLFAFFLPPERTGERHPGCGDDLSANNTAVRTGHLTHIILYPCLVSYGKKKHRKLERRFTFE